MWIEAALLACALVMVQVQLAVGTAVSGEQAM
jgi:hypothetical protein